MYLFNSVPIFVYIVSHMLKKFQMKKKTYITKNIDRPHNNVMCLTYICTSK